jgi:dTMP kinase
MFFTFDGIDGTGKSTQLDLFCQWLESRGKKVVRCRDPGTTQTGEQLRNIVLRRSDLQIDVRSETLIYMAARAQLVHEIIRPALAAGKCVVSDRFLLANVVYQGYGFDLEPDAVWDIGEFATDGLHPHRTFLLDLDVVIAKQRLTGDADRMERRDQEYFERVRQGFLTEARRRPEQIVIINADQTPAQVHADIRVASGLGGESSP